MLTKIFPAIYYINNLVENTFNTPAPRADLEKLEPLILRIQQVIENVNLSMPSAILEIVKCPIALGAPKDPVITKCGHLFEKALLLDWVKANKPCPTCREPVQEKDLLFVPAVKDLIQAVAQKAPILTLPQHPVVNPNRAEKYRQMAQEWIAEGDYLEALEAYSQVLRHANSSEIYGFIPELYVKSKQPKQAALAHLFLVLYQLQESKLEKAIQTFQENELALLDLDPLLLEIALQLDSSSQKVDWAMKRALHQKSQHDRIVTYKQIIKLAPFQWDAYKQLASLLPKHQEKIEILLQAAEQAQKAGRSELEKSFRGEAEMLVYPDTISENTWNTLQVDMTQTNVITDSIAWLAAWVGIIPIPPSMQPPSRLPPYPKELIAFLSEKCTIWPLYKRWQTHIVVFLSPKLEINGEFVPRTLGSLDRLDRATGGDGIIALAYCGYVDIIPAAEESYWAVMTKDILPKSTDLRDDALQIEYPGYETPSILDAVTAFLWEKSRLNSSTLGELYTSCKEKSSYYSVIVRDYSTSLFVGIPEYNDRRSRNKHLIGSTGWKRF